MLFGTSELGVDIDEIGSGHGGEQWGSADNTPAGRACSLDAADRLPKEQISPLQGQHLTFLPWGEAQ